MRTRSFGPALHTASALAVALLLGAVVIAFVQRDLAVPLAAYGALAGGAFGSADAWAATLARTTPLLLTGLAVTVALAAGLFNIGAEGQMAVGGLAAAWVGFGLVGLPVPALLCLALLAGMAAGALWAFLPILLRVTRGAHEVITAILLNYFAANTTRYLATVPLRDPAGQAPQTPTVAVVLPRFADRYEVHLGLAFAVVALIVVAWALKNTVWGFETRAAGQGAEAAEASGIRVRKVQINAFLCSGALAGLAGATVVLGTFRRFPADFYGIGYGFDGLAVALLAAPGGMPSAWGLGPSALLWGALGVGAEAMEFATNTPKQIITVVQAILIVAMASRWVRRNS